MKTIKWLLLLFCAALAFNSCLGVSADIHIRADGSGKIALEYRVSQVLESMGRLDGNERWPAIPVGKADFERSVARIPGLRLSAFSAKSVSNVFGGKDLVTNVTLEFNNTGALLAFLDNTGAGVSFTQENGKNSLRLVLLDEAAVITDDDLLALLQEIAAGYTISVSLSAPKNASLTAIPSSVSFAQMVSQGKKVLAVIGLGDLLALEEGLTVEMSW
ncbi:MAG: hypothetical protein FWD36_02305 [Treponema sp.]|nr:hypothetical protein [Treponema sp.]